jgi:Ca2+-dependent lipid-binding protein
MPPPQPDDSSFMQRVELCISGRKLKDLDVFSKSDPVCFIFEFNEQS